ncbi:hypothetical protein BC828DRAFT_377916 [Blastocladiella britannica]|nr:hypothetical protein BC828DRAFT_377916 [Blastocladiella britannica]
MGASVVAVATPPPPPPLLPTSQAPSRPVPTLPLGPEPKSSSRANSGGTPTAAATGTTSTASPLRHTTATRRRPSRIAAARPLSSVIHQATSAAAAAAASAFGQDNNDDEQHGRKHAPLSPPPHPPTSISAMAAFGATLAWAYAVVNALARRIVPARMLPYVADALSPQSSSVSSLSSSSSSSSDAGGGGGNDPLPGHPRKPSSTTAAAAPSSPPQQHRHRREYVPRRPRLFSKLRQGLAVTTLVVVVSLVGIFLVFAATTLFATTFVGCAVMLLLESTILVIPALIFLTFFTIVLLILGVSWLGLFGLRFGLDSWSLFVNRALSGAHRFAEPLLAFLPAGFLVPTAPRRPEASRKPSARVHPF